MREAELVGQGRKGVRFLYPVQVLAGDVLGQGDLQRGHVVRLADYRRDAGNAGHACRPQPPFAGYQLVVRPLLRLQGPHDDRLHDTQVADGLGQLGQLCLVEGAPRLTRGDGDLGHWDLTKMAFQTLPEEGRKAFAKRLVRCHGKRPPWRLRNRRRSRHSRRRIDRSATSGSGPR